MSATFGERLRSAIKANGLTLGEFARLCGFDPSLLSHYMADERALGLGNISIIVRNLPATDARQLITGSKPPLDIR